MRGGSVFGCGCEMLTYTEGLNGVIQAEETQNSRALAYYRTRQTLHSTNTHSDKQLACQTWITYSFPVFNSTSHVVKHLKSACLHCILL